MTQVSGLITNLSIRQSFFELLRRIDRGSRHLPRLGEYHDNYPARINIVQTADLAFASKELVSIKQYVKKIADAYLIRIECRHFGLLTPYGILPINMTEHARSELILEHNQAFQDFIAIISQRIAILHYRAWAQLHVAVGYDRKNANAFLFHLQQLAGTASNIKLNSHVVKVREAFAGAYLLGKKSLKQLQSILNRYFGVSIQILPRRAAWVSDPHTAHYQILGRLGKTRLGKRFYDAHHAIEIQIGPLSSSNYSHYQSGSQRLSALVAICQDFIEYQLIINIHLLIVTSPDMASHLGSGKLGRNSWLKPQDKIHKQLVYQA